MDNKSTESYQNLSNITGSVDNVTSSYPGNKTTVSVTLSYVDWMLDVSFQFNIYGLFVIHAVGVLTNALVIMTMSATSQLRGNSSGILILTLAISDFLINILRVFEPLIKHDLTCTFLDFAFKAFGMETRCVMVLISINRYALVCHPFKHQKITNNKSTLIQVALLSVLSVASSFYSAVSHRYDPDTQNCLVNIDTMTSFYMYFYGTIFGFLVLGNIVPMLVTSVLTVLTIHQLRLSGGFKKAVKGDSNTVKAQRSITKALLGVGIVFILTGVPYFINYTIYAAMFGIGKDLFPNFRETLTALNYFRTIYEINHSVNFFIYIAYHTKFKSTFLKIVKCSCSNLNDD